jgi:hypothetical protein
MRHFHDLRKIDRDLGEEYSVRSDKEMIIVAIVFIILATLLVIFG